MKIQLALVGIASVLPLVQSVEGKLRGTHAERHLEELDDTFATIEKAQRLYAASFEDRIKDLDEEDQADMDEEEAITPEQVKAAKDAAKAAEKRAMEREVESAKAAEIIETAMEQHDKYILSTT